MQKAWPVLFQWCKWESFWLLLVIVTFTDVIASGMYPAQVSDETGVYVKAYLKVFDNIHFFPHFCRIFGKQHLYIYLLCIFKHQVFKLSLSKTELTDWTAKIARKHQSVLRNKILLQKKEIIPEKPKPSCCSNLVKPSINGLQITF